MRRIHARYRLDALTRQSTRADVTSGRSLRSTTDFLIHAENTTISPSPCLSEFQNTPRPKLFEDCYFIYLIRLNYRISPVRVRTSFGTPKDSQGSGPEYHHNTAHGSIFQLHLHCAHSHFSNDYIFTALLGYAVLYCCARLYCLSPETAEYLPRLHPIMQQKRALVRPVPDELIR